MKSFLIFLKIILIIFIFPGVNRGGDMKNLFKNIPKEILVWKSKVKDEIFNRDTIFKHINGGAELYLAYDFKQVFVRKFSEPRDNEIIMDIYDMGSSNDAFGVFTSEREDDDAGIGQGSEYSSGLLRFWKDRYFVSILAVGDDRAAKPAIFKLGKAVATLIKSTGSEPDLLKHLPRKNIDKKRIRFFHTQLLLNKHYFVSDENILNLNNQTDCLMAEFPDKNESSTFLLLIQYKTNTQARNAHDKFLRIYMPEAKDSGYIKTENQKWSIAKIDQDMVKIVFDAPSKSQALDLLKAIKHVKENK